MTSHSCCDGFWLAHSHFDCCFHVFSLKKHTIFVKIRFFGEIRVFTRQKSGVERIMGWIFVWFKTFYCGKWKCTNIYWDWVVGNFFGRKHCAPFRPRFDFNVIFTWILFIPLLMNRFFSLFTGKFYHHHGTIWFVRPVCLGNIHF